MRKITIKPKPVALYIKETTRVVVESISYTCPTCFVTFELHGIKIQDNVTQFRCERCNQELVIKSRITKKEETK